MTVPVLLLRPQGQNERLAGLLRGRGLTVVIEPMLKIEPVADSAGLRSTIASLDEYDDVIFVSANAARLGIDRLQAWWPQWPAKLRWFAVGDATASVLGEFDLPALTPAEPSSEGLLSMPELERLDSRKVLIVRGEGGREVLRDGLIARGAKVTYLETYTRTAVQLDTMQRAELETLCPLIAVVYSGETVSALNRNIEGFEKGVTVIVASERIGEVAREAGAGAVHVAAPDDNAMVSAIESLAG